MSEEKPKSGKLKGIIGAFAGLLSGGAMMYLSPLVDRVIKPQKPFANFAVENNGLQVTVHNRSAGGDGWWDFGDASALEPATSASEAVNHTYAKPGAYTVKLSLRNFLGDEAERAVQVELNGQATAAAPPAILKLDAIPLSPQPIAPATFRLVGTAQNAELAVWDVDEQLEIVKDSPNQQDKLVTFNAPGRHTVQFAVLNGSTTQKQVVTVDVRPARRTRCWPCCPSPTPG
ncbi:MAG TPA: PKD domain-containing protein [Gemmataceae bacterium]